MEEKLPTNICQVGQAEECRKIFIEEYVVSFLQEMMKTVKEPQIVVFFGDGYERQGIKYYFLKGAAAHRASDSTLKKMDEFYFQTIGRQYFPALKGIGWYYMKGRECGILEMLQHIREQNFHDIEGYYLFFEKNEGMEEYMLHRQRKQKNQTAVVPKLPETKPFSLKEHMAARKAEAKKPAPMAAVQILNMVSLCILIICCIIAVTTLNQYDKMKRLEETVTYLEISMEEQKNLPEE